MVPDATLDIIRIIRAPGRNPPRRENGGLSPPPRECLTTHCRPRHRDVVVDGVTGDPERDVLASTLGDARLMDGDLPVTVCVDVHHVLPIQDPFTIPAFGPTALVGEQSIAI